MKNGYYHAHYGDKVKLLHRVVWEYYNGEIPSNYHVHHIDGNKDNNDISNLELIDSHEHLSYHSKKKYAENKEVIDKHLAEIQELARAWHSSPEGRAWHSEHGKQVFENMPNITLICQNCGNEYTVKLSAKNKSKFCSNNCKSAYRRKLGIDNIEVICPVCSSKFIKNKYSKRKFCSRKCRLEYED